MGVKAKGYSLLLVDDAVEEIGTLKELQDHLHFSLGLIHLSQSQHLCGTSSGKGPSLETDATQN